MKHAIFLLLATAAIPSFGAGNFNCKSGESATLVIAKVASELVPAGARLGVLSHSNGRAYLECDDMSEGKEQQFLCDGRVIASGQWISGEIASDKGTLNLYKGETSEISETLHFTCTVAP